MSQREIEAVHFSETSIPAYLITLPHNPEGSNLNDSFPGEIELLLKYGICQKNLTAEIALLIKPKTVVDWTKFKIILYTKNI
jgi:hypothetical protein